MISFLIAFALTFAPSPTDTFTTPFSIAFAKSAPTVETAEPPPAPAVVAAPAPIAAITPVAPATPTQPVAPAAKADDASLFVGGGLLDPSRLRDIARGETKLSADAVVGKVQEFYKDTVNLQAKFRQTVKNATFGRESVSDGWVFIKKPGKMRWDYYSKKDKKKVSKSFISDGTDIWAVFHTDLQFYKRSVKDEILPVAITFLAGKGDLKSDFSAEIDTKAGYGASGDYVIKLTPKTPNAAYSNLWLVVDPSTYRVKQSIVLNSKGDTNMFAFHEGETTKELKDTIFVFDEKQNKKFRLVNPDDAPAN